jgi:hypothetical protein
VTFGTLKRLGIKKSGFRAGLGSTNATPSGSGVYDQQMRLPSNIFQRANGNDDTDYAYDSQEHSTNERDSISCGTWWRDHDPYGPLILCTFDGTAVFVGGVLGGIFLCYGRRRWLGCLFIGLGFLLCGIGTFLAGWGWAWVLTCQRQTARRIAIRIVK